ncbi:hypothetical protein WJX73_002967 [Symbiochloris irregularis]|uniref:Thioredoxin domain-containing protein n=1 Tax=Symbiochloris irregularis TaxID=706552 RepID=A0AAW1PK81_9CHLO
MSVALGPTLGGDLRQACGLQHRLAPSGACLCSAAPPARRAGPQQNRPSRTILATTSCGSLRNSTRVSAAVLEQAAPQQTQAKGEDWESFNAEFQTSSPLQVVDWALERFKGEIGIAFSGAEDVALVEYAHLTGRPYRVFSLDTGRLNAETYQLFQKVEDHYGIRIEYTFPDAQETMDLVREKGMFSFYKDGHQECCRIRKVRPLRRHLGGLKAWITGQRKDQSPGTRAEIPVVQVDPAFEGLDGGAGSLIKFNPLADMSSAEVWNFLRVMGVPTNDLHQRGFVSIGCEPCTIPVLPHQHEREGRWAWEDATAKECGLHSGNIKLGGGADGAGADSQRDLWANGSAVEALSKQQLESLVHSQGQRDKDTLVVLYAPWCPFSQAMEPSYEQLAAEIGNDLRIAKFQADTDDARPFASSELGLKTFPTIVLLPKSGGPYIKYGSERRDVQTLKMWLRTVASA